MAPSLGAFITIDSSSSITGPPAVLQKDLSFRLQDHGPSGAPSTGKQTPTTPNELESFRLSYPAQQDAVDVVQTLSNPPMNKYRLLSCCLMNFGNGLNDSAPGALIPYIEDSYHIGYAIVSLIFVANAIGFISAAPITYALQARVGRANTLVIAEGCMLGMSCWYADLHSQSWCSRSPC